MWISLPYSLPEQVRRELTSVSSGSNWENPSTIITFIYSICGMIDTTNVKAKFLAWRSFC